MARCRKRILSVCPHLLRNVLRHHLMPLPAPALYLCLLRNSLLRLVPFPALELLLHRLMLMITTTERTSPQERLHKDTV